MSSSSAASIKPAVMDVYTVENHMISCELNDIPTQISGISWTPTNQAGPPNSYTVADGTHDHTHQTSTLSISAARLTSLKGSGRTITFTCRITVGTSNTAVSATQTISIYTPSKFFSSFIQILLVKDITDTIAIINLYLLLLESPRNSNTNNCSCNNKPCVYQRVYSRCPHYQLPTAGHPPTSTGCSLESGHIYC